MKAVFADQQFKDSFKFDLNILCLERDLLHLRKERKHEELHEDRLRKDNF